jgi:SPP1 family predicted phage head-tail adaptor
MRAGPLRHKITLRQKTATRSSSGAQVTTWIDFAVGVPAEVTPLSGREYISMRQAQSDITTRVRMRYLAGVNSQMRVQWENKDYEIREVIDVRARRVELEILCVGAAGDV